MEVNGKFCFYIKLINRSCLVARTFSCSMFVRKYITTRQILLNILCLLGWSESLKSLFSFDKYLIIRNLCNLTFTRMFLFSDCLFYSILKVTKMSRLATLFAVLLSRVEFRDVYNANEPTVEFTV